MAFDPGSSGLSPIRRRGSNPTPPMDVSAGNLSSAGPLGLYIHFPFCGVHCPYCDFAVEARADIPHDQYANAIIAEIASRSVWFGGTDRNAGAAVRPALASIYLGGGTPGLWRPDAIARVIAAGKRTLGAGETHEPEITVEANPGEVDDVALRGLRQAGVNRLSLGIQSLDDRLLRLIGRNHVAAAGPAAVAAARAAGIDNLSIDLMFALPGQSFDDWRRSVDGVLALRPDHVSAYSLTIERGTVFGARARKGDLVVPDDEEAARMQEWVRDALAAGGLDQYEVSSYARPGRRAVHNGLYWTGAPYLGVGASAASFRPLDDGSGWRFSNPRATETYLRAAQ
ncbi:MAG: radical SAM family heme chaperone HemW, partial [Deltaproteobacteria bacterium]|nr:radical SAM family heme chaperone HemW [Deltaproteobacteria bacterium]